MSAASVRDEYDALFASNKPRPRHHPAEVSSSGSDDEQDEPRTTNTASSSNRISNATTLTSNSGKYTRSANYIHGSNRRSDGDADDDADSDREDDQSDYEYESRHTNRKPTKYYLPRNYDSNAQTGPKGVIADARAFEDAKQVGNRTHLARTVDLTLPKAQRPSEEEEDEWGEDMDEEVVEKWNRARMAELKLATTVPDGQVEKRFKGKLKRVDGQGFLEAVDGAPKGMIVLVYIYDDQLLLSEAYESHLKALASKNVSVVFVSLHYKDAQMEHAGVPALLAYKNGDKFADLVPLNEEVPFSANVASNLEDVLWSHGMLE